MRALIIAILIFIGITGAYAQTGKDTIKLADPSIFSDGGTFYLYGTGSPNGFPVYASPNLVNWQRQNKNALLKGDAYGTKGFWAPQVIKHNSKYYMAYTADEHIAIAESDSPLGPFKQKLHQSISLQGKQIDPFIFRDTNGDMYLYFVRLQQGNRIFSARLKTDLSDIDSATVTECLHAEQGWENTANSSWPVSEGPTVIKAGNLYYLFYSANDFRNIDYAVGYATSPSPLGPWNKYSGNPVLSRKNTGYNGSGHGDVLEKNGKFYYVFHTHNTNNNVGVRKTAIVELAISDSKPAAISVIPGSFRYLTGQ